MRLVTLAKPQSNELTLFYTCWLCTAAMSHCLPAMTLSPSAARQFSSYAMKQISPWGDDEGIDKWRALRSELRELYRQHQKHDVCTLEEQRHTLSLADQQQRKKDVADVWYILQNLYSDMLAVRRRREQEADALQTRFFISIHRKDGWMSRVRENFILGRESEKMCNDDCELSV
jgi:hypothetical protein